MARRNDLFSVAPVTVALLALNIGLYLFCAYLSRSLQINADVNIAFGASMREGLWDGEWYRLVMPNFLHWSMLHILLNMMVLKSLGPSAEIYFGSSNFGTLYLISGAAGFCFSQLFGGHLAAGASAAIFGLMGAELCVRLLHLPVLAHAWRNSEVREISFWIGINFLLGISGMMGPIDNWAHFGGFIFGLLLAGFFEFWRRRRRIGLPLLVAMLLLVGGLIGVTRWTFFSPYYHIQMAVLDKQAGNPAEMEAQFAQAARWGKIWRMEKETGNFIDATRDGDWTHEMSRRYGYALVAGRMRSWK